MTVQELARDAVVTAPENEPIQNLAEGMREENVGSVVIENDESPVGIVTDRDLATRVLADGTDPSTQTAADVMSDELCTVGPDAGFYEAAQAMSENGVRRLPICNADGDLEGIITADDLSELLAEENQQLASVIQAQRPSY
jgi:CBS domain-containing protein